MKSSRWRYFPLALCFCFVFALTLCQGLPAMPGVDIYKASDISDFDPYNLVIPTSDTMSCDHPAIMDLYATEFVYPNKRFPHIASNGKS